MSAREHAFLREILSERGNGDRTPEDYDRADAALDALLADNEGLREALERISTSRRSGMTAHAHVAFLQQEARAALAPEQEQETCNHALVAGTRRCIRCGKAVAPEQEQR